MKVQHIRKTHKKTIRNQGKPRSIASILFSWFVKFVFCGILLFVFAIFAAPYVFDERLEVTRISLTTEKTLHWPVRIALITDLHGAAFGAHQEELLSKIKTEEPDFVALVGDIFGTGDTEKETEDLIQGLLADGYPIYYVSGNAEFESKRIEAIKESLVARAITVLDGHTSVYTRERYGFTDRISISGVDDPENPIENTVFQLKRAYSEVTDLDDYKILLAHRPELIDEYLKFPYDLILSGHAHGGQWRIPRLLENGFYASGQGFFPSLTGGVSRRDKTDLVISRGLSGRLSVEVPRIFNRPELVIIEIKKQ
ncbi:MAG: metallophosphoesterase [Fusobacteriaceae bacterium]|jgi:predicted MPP superfamily phosphohydrolase|nr:metallophosphoesterase [Fusobacteriaceae bacterium]